jgi:hypothetical protein
MIGESGQHKWQKGRWIQSRSEAVDKERSQEGEASWAFAASKGGFGRNLVPSHDKQESFPNWSGRRADTLLLGVDASNAR